MAESTPLRIVMAPKTKRTVALGLAVEAYSDYGLDEDEGRWADRPDFHAQQVTAVAETFLAFLEAGKDD